jgi:hypothetical protein
MPKCAQRIGFACLDRQIRCESIEGGSRHLEHFRMQRLKGQLNAWTQLRGNRSDESVGTQTGQQCRIVRCHKIETCACCFGSTCLTINFDNFACSIGDPGMGSDHPNHRGVIEVSCSGSNQID